MIADDPVAELRAIAKEIGAIEIGDDAAALSARIIDGLFYVACIGQFKRGKSTLINALVGRPLLPVGVVPVTAVITIVRHGEAVGAHVLFEDGRNEKVDPSRLEDYISEERNPENTRHVRAVEVTVPNELLARGMCLVDTPGLGSIFRRNTETTRAFLPHIDAALVVLGGDPPISGEEAALVEEIAHEVPEMLVVLNKADRLDAADVAQAASFTREALTARIGREPRLFVVSAVEQLNGARTRDWPALEEALATLSRDAGADLVRSAEKRGRRRIAARLIKEIEQQRDALTRPLAETEARVTALRQTIADARRALSDLGYLFTAEQHRLTREFDEERTRFLETTLSAAATEFDSALAASTRVPRADVFRTAEQIAQRAVTSWMETIEPRAEALYARATDRFIELTRDFLRRFEIGEDEDLDFEQHFRKRRGFYFTSLMTLTGRPPGASLGDLLRTPNRQRERTHRDATGYLRRLLESNSARVANDLTERVLESRRVLEREIRSVLDRATASAERALDRARASQREGSAAVADRIAALEVALDGVARAGRTATLR